MSTVPLIDLGPFRHGNTAARAEVAAQVDRACREIGFLVVANHGVPEELIEATRGAAAHITRRPGERMETFFSHRWAKFLDSP